MKTLQDIKNNYAQERGYEDWEAFLNYYGGRHPEWFDQHWQEICIRAQKALNTIHLTYDKGDGEVFCAFTDENQCKSDAIDSGCGMQTVRLVWNEENLIR